MINCPTITVHELKQVLDDFSMSSTSQGYLIDVREDYEWQEVRIPGAIHMPKGEITKLIDTKVKNKTSPVYLYCRGGVRSLDAVKLLLDLGYEKVYSVEGGISQWAQCGYSVDDRVYPKKIGS